MPEEINISINDIIPDTFVEIFDDIVNCKVDRAICRGGRSTTKSQTASSAVLVGCMVNKASAVACVKYANNIEKRLVNTFKASIKYLGVEQWWKLRKSPFELVLLDADGKETDVSIQFTGCEDPENLKSTKPRAGSFMYVWFEELTNFKSLKEVNNAIQTLARGIGKHTVVMTYNPPMQSSNWVNKEYNCPIGTILEFDTNSIYTEFEFELDGEIHKTRQVIHHSTYLDVIASGHADWLGTTFIGEAKQSEIENNLYYRWAYLGEVVGTDANVFNNVKDWDGVTDGLDITTVYRGFDWGYGGPDSSAYTCVYYDNVKKHLYILDEFGRPKMQIEEVIYEMKARNKHNFPIYADPACDLLNQQLRKEQLNVPRWTKKPGSVMAGIKWLQSLNGIYICKTRTPKAYREFTEYEYKVNKNDEVTAELGEHDNHYISSVRYGLVNVIKYL